MQKVVQKFKVLQIFDDLKTNLFFNYSVSTSESIPIIRHPEKIE